MDSMIDPSGTQDNMMDTSNSMMMPQSSGMPPPMSMSIDPEGSSEYGSSNPSVAISTTSNYNLRFKEICKISNKRLP